VIEGIRIRAPRQEEYGVCRMLLPPDPLREFTPEQLIAVQDQEPFVVGAASYGLSNNLVHNIRMRVIRTHRRRGIGSCLTAHLEALARQRNAEALLGTSDAVSEPEAAAFLTSLGFTAAGHTKTVQAEIEPAARILLPMADRLALRSPELSRIVPLAQAPRNAVTALFKVELARSPVQTLWSLLDSLSSERLAKSPVLLAGDQVAGFLLVFLQDDLGVIPARVVAPEFQRGAANILLMGAGLRLGLEHGTKKLEFEIPENNFDTENLARRLEAKVVRTRDQYIKRLTAA
jgi:GNAT superfamily N-acetyltransferase